MREKTRRERYAEKNKIAKKLPISIATINFEHDVNLAYVIRSAACFGASQVLAIGNHPPRHLMNELSGSMFDYVDLHVFRTPSNLLEYTRKLDMNLVSIELPEDSNFISHSIFDFEFNFDKHLCLVVGHETTGVPIEILHHSDIVYIDMDGVGYCLNTAQAANIALYEAVRQYRK